MAFLTEIEKPNNSPVVLVQLDIGQDQTFFVNYSAGVWYVNFDATYPECDDTLLNGVEIQNISSVGSVIVDGIRLLNLSTLVLCQTTESSFYYSAADNELYVHLDNGYSPEDHEVVIGVSWGFRKGGQTSIYSNFLYEDRINSINSISTQKDPTFFGVMAFNSFSLDIINVDGEYDRFAIDNDAYGGEGRVYLGFDGDDFTEFHQIFQGLIENPSVSENFLSITLQDNRKRLLRTIPTNVFNTTDYADLNADNVGASIPLAYGTIRNAPVLCTNDDEAPAPANYSFKLVDVSDHTNGIGSIDTVYVEGVSKAFVADITNGEFTIAAANYTPGQDVTCDFTGFIDDDSNLIENAHDIIADLMNIYANQPFISDIFNTAHWDKVKSPDISIFISDKEKLIDIINRIITNAILGVFNVEDDGRYALRIFDSNNASLYTIPRINLESTPRISFNNSKVVSSTIVKYYKDWSEDNYRLLVDTSQESTVYNKFRIYNQEEFETLLNNSTDAQSFSDTILEFSGDVESVFTMTTDFRYITLEIGDIVTVDLSRANGVSYIGDVKCEIIGKTYDLSRYMASYICRVFEFVEEMVYTQGTWYNGSYYNDSYYGVSGNYAV